MQNQLKVWGLYLTMDDSSKSLISLHRTKEGAENKIKEKKRNHIASIKLMSNDYIEIIEYEDAFPWFIFELPVEEDYASMPVPIALQKNKKSGFFYTQPSDVFINKENVTVKGTLYNVILINEMGVEETYHVSRDNKNKWVIGAFKTYKEILDEIRSDIDKIEGQD
jgi:hypothetical protein